MVVPVCISRAERHAPLGQSAGEFVGIPGLVGRTIDAARDLPAGTLQCRLQCQNLAHGPARGSPARRPPATACGQCRPATPPHPDGNTARRARSGRIPAARRRSPRAARAASTLRAGASAACCAVPLPRCTGRGISATTRYSRGSAENRNRSAWSFWNSDFSRIQGARGEDQTNEWPGAIIPALPQLVSRATASWRSSSTTSCPSLSN